MPDAVSSPANYDPGIHYPLLIKLKKKKKVMAPPSWAKAGGCRRERDRDREEGREGERRGRKR